MQNKKSSRKRYHQPYLKFMGYLKENNIHLNEISDVLDGITVQTISQKNHGWADYSMTEINKICDHFKISIEMFRINKH
ncbi:MAG: hypothetical protein FIA99_05505 [Ruminiclostridium sp.]|nr:hypothetical protein [Ruminiclostridium sp.]